MRCLKFPMHCLKTPMHCLELPFFMRCLKLPGLAAFVSLIVLSASALATPPGSDRASETDAEPKVERAGQPGVEAPAEPGPEQPQRQGSRFLRIARDEDGDALALETAIIRYVPTDPALEGLVVDLIGVVHFGEMDYYGALNERFEQYDALLYELVAPKGVVPKKEKQAPRDLNPLSSLIAGMQQALELEHQLHAIDYSRPNFIHADMTPEQLGEAFSKAFSEQEGSLLETFLKSQGQGIALESQTRTPSSAMLLYAMVSKNRAYVLRRMLAEPFEQMELAMDVLGSPATKALIVDRNRVALDVLQEQIAAGKKRIGIFYGAGHMPDLEQRLVEEFGLRPQEPEWMRAWHLRAPQQQADAGDERK